MTQFDPTSDDNDVTGPPEQSPLVEPQSANQDVANTAGTGLQGDPITYAASTLPPTGRPLERPLREDIRVPWSWGHFLIFLFFSFASFLVVQTGLAIYYAPRQHLSKEQYEHYLLNKPEFLFGSNLLWYALIFLFLYVTLSVLRDAAFWDTLRWRPLGADPSGRRSNPWKYFFSGCALAIFVALAGSQVHTNENMPIQELLKNRQSALLLMSMAVIVAPLVEETVFRGYLYPLFAKSFGIAPAIFVTGLLFGLMHGSQLGWSWGIVGLLILVGVIFTYARAYTGTVLASYLLHLGYNSAIAVTSIISTRGFTHMPPLPR
jgi:membrane protease YdiL (CAAX protease family)